MTDISLSTLMEQAVELRDQKAEAEAVATDLGKRLDDTKRQIIELMQAMGIEKSGHNGISCSVSTKPVPSIEDFAAVGEYIVRTGNVHLLQKRLSTTVYADLMELETDGIPGISTFDKTELSLRVSRR